VWPVAPPGLSAELHERHMADHLVLEPAPAGPARDVAAKAVADARAAAPPETCALHAAITLVKTKPVLHEARIRSSRTLRRVALGADLRVIAHLRILAFGGL
jgi:hypothetical protein